MSEIEKEKLRKLVRERPAIADVPFIVIKGKPISPKEASAILEQKRFVDEIRTAMIAIKFREEELWSLTEEYYRRLLRLPPPYPVTYIIVAEEKTEFTLQECLAEVRQRTKFGRDLMQGYQKLIAQMLEWMG